MVSHFTETVHKGMIINASLMDDCLIPDTIQEDYHSYIRLVSGSISTFVFIIRTIACIKKG